MKRGNFTKNRYRILREDKRTNFRAIELFAGAGGLALEFENAGIRHQLPVECDRTCVETLRNNRPDRPTVCNDVSNISVSEFRHKIDIVSGGFPGQAFSHAGVWKMRGEHCFLSSPGASKKLNPKSRSPKM